MKVLYLAHRIPYPPNKGDKIRSFHQIKYLAQKHQIYVASLYDQKQDVEYHLELSKLVKIVGLEYVNPYWDKLWSVRGLLRDRPLSALYFYKKKLQAKIDSFLLTTRPDVIFCFSSVMAEYVLSSKVQLNVADRPRLIMDFCDLDSDKWKQYAQSFSFPYNWIYNWEARLLFEYEKKVNQLFDHSIFVSRSEAGLFLTRFPQAKNVHVIKNGVDTTYFDPQKNYLEGSTNIVSHLQGLEGKLVLMFSGAMDYQANVDGVLWFCKEVYPYLRQQLSELCFLIVGSNPDKKILDLHGQNNIVVTGFVPDIRPYYQRADVCVVPLRLARGIQNKVLEAMAMARPVVLTDKARQGIEAYPGNFFREANHPQEFVEQIMSLLKDKEKHRQAGRLAREFVLGNFSWEKSLSRLEDLFN